MNHKLLVLLCFFGEVSAQAVFAIQAEREVFNALTKEYKAELRPRAFLKSCGAVQSGIRESYVEGYEINLPLKSIADRLPSVIKTMNSYIKNKVTSYKVWPHGVNSLYVDVTYGPSKIFDVSSFVISQKGNKTEMCLIKTL